MLPPNPAEALGSERIRALKSQLEAEADMVIFDSPPCLPLTDAAILARLVDGVVLVVDSGRGRAESALRAKELLEKVGGHILGVVLNRINPRSSAYHYYYYYYSHGEESNRKRQSASPVPGMSSRRRPLPATRGIAGEQSRNCYGGSVWESKKNELDKYALISACQMIEPRIILTRPMPIAAMPLIAEMRLTWIIRIHSVSRPITLHASNLWNRRKASLRTQSPTERNPDAVPSAVTPAELTDSAASSRRSKQRLPTRLLEVGLWGLAIVLSVFAIYSAWRVFFPQEEQSSLALGVHTETSTISSTLSITLSPTSPPTERPTVPPTATSLPTLLPLAIPTPPNDGTVLTLFPDATGTGWLASGEAAPHWGDPNLHVGSFQNQTYSSFLRFSSSDLPPGSKILFAALELTGLDEAHLAKAGDWRLELIANDRSREGSQVSSNDMTEAETLSIIGRPLAASELAVGHVNRFEFNEAQLKLLEKQLAFGLLTFRISASKVSGDDLFTWDTGLSAGSSLAAPSLYLVAVPGPFTVVTNTPTPSNVLTAAAFVFKSTARAQQVRNTDSVPAGSGDGDAGR